MAIKDAPEPPQFVPTLTPCNLPVERCPVPREQAARRILILRAAALGDILMATVILPPIRQQFPDAHITWIAEKAESAVIRANPYVDEVIVWSSPFWKRMVRGLRYVPWIGAMLRFRRELHARNYDTYISFQPEEWALLTKGTGAGIRVGIFDTFKRFYKAQRTSSNTKLYTHSFTYPELPEHRIDQYLLTLDALGIPRPAEKRTTFGYTAEDRDKANAFLAAQGIGVDERFVILVPQTTWTTKCWDADRFVTLGKTLAAKGYRLVLSGSPKEAEAVRAVAAQITPAPVVVAGELSFREFAAVIDRALLLVSGDTGPMHAATALGTPTVSLWGATAPEWYGPVTGSGIAIDHPVPCGPCDRKLCANTGADFEMCMRLITVDEVTAACVQLLEGTAPR